MGKALGMPEWLAISVWVILILAVVFAVGVRSLREAHRHLAERRPNPTYEEFASLMAGEADLDVIAWMWDNLGPYYRPLTPHPDDHLIRDARIDDDDVTMDWLPAFAKSRGMTWKDWPPWPREWELTARNFMRWLQLGVDVAGKETRSV